MSILSFKSRHSKKIFAGITAAGLGSTLQPVAGQVTTWTGDTSNVWANFGNWNPVFPSTTSTAVIATGGTGDNLFLRSGRNDAFSAGTIIFAHTSYRNILAGTGIIGAATVNFGTSAGIDVDAPPAEKGPKRDRNEDAASLARNP